MKLAKTQNAASWARQQLASAEREEAAMMVYWEQVARGVRIAREAGHDQGVKLLQDLRAFHGIREAA